MQHLLAPARITVGTLLLAAGVAMLVLPGPGLLTIAGALHLLAKDVPVLRPAADWAHATLARIAARLGAPEPAFSRR